MRVEILVHDPSAKCSMRLSLQSVLLQRLPQKFNDNTRIKIIDSVTQISLSLTILLSLVVFMLLMFDKLPETSNSVPLLCTSVFWDCRSVCFTCNHIFKSPSLDKQLTVDYTSISLWEQIVALTFGSLSNKLLIRRIMLINNYSNCSTLLWNVHCARIGVVCGGCARHLCILPR